jgi:programmed cell death protein 5
MPPGMMGGMDGAAKAKEQQEKQKAADEQRAQILKAVLTPGARERLANIAMVKADKARRIEDMIITQAGRGVIDGVLEEEQLIQMLESISEAENKGKGTGKITIQRKRMDDDDDW